MWLTKFDVVGHSPTAYKERLFLYLIDLPAHQVNDVFPANLHLAAETLRDREFLQPVEVFMVAVKEQERVRQFLYLSYIFLVEYALFRPEKTEIPKYNQIICTPERRNRESFPALEQLSCVFLEIRKMRISGYKYQ